MQLTQSAGYLAIHFDRSDWSIRSQSSRKWAVLDMIAAMKLRIPPEDREYDDTNRTWYIRPEHAEAIRELRKEFLQDKNQQEMF